MPKETKEQMKQRKEELRQQRNEALELSDYDTAAQLLKEIQDLNRKIYYDGP